MLSVVSALVLSSTDALAHKPFFGPGHASAETALVLEDPDISIVLYQEITCDEPQLWVEFDADAGYEAWVQLGVPEIERLEDYRPSLAVIAPGLPQVELGFALPEGTGAVVFDTTDLDQVGEFYEPFTQTSSWILVEEWVELPEGGPAWVVAWDPQGWTGKAWIAVGTVEDFSDLTVDDFTSISEDVHDFHETGRYEDPPDVEEVQCDQVQGDEEVDLDGTDAEPSGGCSTVAGGGLAGALLALTGLVRRRRR